MFRGAAKKAAWVFTWKTIMTFSTLQHHYYYIIHYKSSSFNIQGGTIADKQTISFVIPPAELHISKIEPIVGRTGETITIKGSGFGTDSSKYKVIFNAGAYPGNLRHRGRLLEGQ